MKVTHYDDHRTARAAEYPAIADQLDVIWTLLDTQYGAAPIPLPAAEAMRQQIKAIKAKYPKPPGIE